jgi:NADPH:quinone reductase-like Zn-dependent oxidoreductase
MRAIVQDRYGSSDVLELRDIDRPLLGDNDVLVKVHAAGLDRGVWHVMTGLPYLIRLLGFGFRTPNVRVRGRELAGVVEAVGTNVTQFQPGDEVYGTADGSFAEYACTREDMLAPKPANLDFAASAVTPISGSTALQALRLGEVRSGQRVLVIGAAGGVGTYAVQLAKAFGAEVTGVCSTTKLDLVRSIGADDVIDYTREDFAKRVRRYDLIIDTAGNRSLSHLRRSLNASGTLVIVGGETGGKWLGGFDRSLRAPWVSLFVGQRLCALASKEDSVNLRALTEYLEAGTVKPVIDRTFPLSEVSKAIRYLEDGHPRGKVVITMQD